MDFRVEHQDDLRRHQREFARAMQLHGNEIRKAIEGNKYEWLEDGSGIYVPGTKALVQGMYESSIIRDGEEIDWRWDKNLVPTEGLNHFLDVVLRNQAQNATWYLPLSSGNVSPASTWTAANYSANATEITSPTEGYTEATRQAFVPAAASGGVITSNASKAAFTIETASSLNVWGTALLSSSTKGGGSGKLASAVKFAIVRTLQDTDIFNLGYSITMTST